MFNIKFSNFFVMRFERRQTKQPINQNVCLTERNLRIKWDWLSDKNFCDLLRKVDKWVIKLRTFPNFLHRSLTVGTAISVHPLQKSAWLLSIIYRTSFVYLAGLYFCRLLFDRSERAVISCAGASTPQR